MSRETIFFARQRIIIARAVVIPWMALVFMTESAWELVPALDSAQAPALDSATESPGRQWVVYSKVVYTSNVDELHILPPLCFYRHQRDDPSAMYPRSSTPDRDCC